MTDLSVNPQEEIKNQRPASNTQYIIAVCIMLGFSVAGATVVSVVRPGQDNAALITAIFGFLTPTTLSLLAFMKSQETHLAVNSRLTQFIENAKQANIEIGINKGVIQGTDAANARTDELNKQ